MENLDAVLPREGLTRYLDETFGPSGDPIEASKLGEGHSNLTFLIRRGENSWVLRRPPRGVIRPGTRQMDREYKIMHALEQSADPVPVPHQIALCEDASYIGAPFYLMAPVDGVVIRGGIPEQLAPQRREIGWELADTLAAIHAVDWKRAGLESMAREPHNFVPRNLERMQQLYEMDKTRDVPEIRQVGEWLRAHVPADREVALSHGDYKLDNVMFARELPARLVAVLDWEVATIGDPMVDVGWLLYFSYDSTDPAGATVGGTTSGQGYPTRAELAERYAKMSGRDVRELAFYSAMAGWKIAIIMEGSNRRFKEGMADDPMFATLDAGVRSLARRSLDIISGDVRVV
jgi:aminoglycoside phosphotransferase (APT) family kinase protein